MRLASSMLMVMVVGCLGSSTGCGKREPAVPPVIVSKDKPAPPVDPAKSEEPVALAGTWDWGWADVGQEPVMMTTITLYADGQAVVPGVKGKWERSGNNVTIRWNSGAIDTLTLSADGTTLDGHNNAKRPVRGKKR